MENLDEIVGEGQPVSGGESIANSTMHYEMVCNALFRRLGIKPNQRQLIRAFIEASQGKKEFEVSYLELADILFEKDSASKDTLKKRVADWLKVLLVWQEKNGVELIRILEPGRKIENETGRFEYSNSVYELVMLDGFQKLIASNSEDLSVDIDEFILSLDAQFQPIKRVEKYHPRHQARKNKNTVLTKFKRIFELMVEIDENPVKYCQLVLDDACKTLNELEANWIEQRTREKLLSEFESYLNNNEFSTEEEDSGLKL